MKKQDFKEIRYGTYLKHDSLEAKQKLKQILKIEGEDIKVKWWTILWERESFKVLLSLVIRILQKELNQSIDEFLKD